MLNVLRVLTDGPVLLLGGIVLLIFGAAGLLGEGGAGHTPLRTARGAVFAVQLAVGAVLAGVGAAMVLG